MRVTTSSFEERLQARRDCEQKEKEVLDEAVALRKDMPARELAAHLGAAGAGPDAVREREEEIRNRIAKEQEMQAALRMSKDHGMSMLTWNAAGADRRVRACLIKGS